jgi:cysteine-rich repeat protein
VRERAVTRARAAAALAAVCLASLACKSSRTDVTSLIVQVQSDLAVGTQIDQITVNQLAKPLASPGDLPLTVAFTPSGADDQQIQVTATALLGGANVVSQSFVTSFQPGKVVLLVMSLDAACLPSHVTCGAGQTCEHGQCVPMTRVPTSYPPSDAGTDGPATDGGADMAAGADTGTDVARVDAGVDRPADSPDTGEPEAGLDADAAPPVEAGADGPKEAGAEVAAGVCGNGVTDPGEQCDDMGESATCNADCTFASCGDGKVNKTRGEDCDTPGGADTATCNGAFAGTRACKTSACGDGYVNAAAGETCEVAGADTAQCNGTAAGAALACKTPVCGDGYINAAAGETCDDHNTSSGDGCSGQCKTEAGFTCTAPGPSTCTTTCGDGIRAGAEVCDDHNTSVCGTCNAACSAAQPATAATGTITAVQATSFLNGESFTLADGIHPPTVFEFNATTVSVAGHVLVTTQGGSTINAAKMAMRIVAAINGVGGALFVTATVNASNASQALLTNDNLGVIGNLPIIENVAAAGFVVTGMAGGVAGDCAVGVGCDSNGDCATGSCCLTGACAHTCRAAACTDGVRNGNETDVDCGGTCPRCADGRACISASDCVGFICTPAGTCASPSCTDGVLNGAETDVDCGGGASGSGCPPCGPGKGCETGSDCTSGVCTGSCA